MNYFRAFESAKSVYILLLNAFVSFAFFLLAIIINEADHFNQGFLNSFSDFFLFSFWQQFSVFSVLHLIIYTITFILITEVFLFLCKIVTQFLLIVPEECIVLFLFYHLLQQLLEILFVELLWGLHLKLFFTYVNYN